MFRLRIVFTKLKATDAECTGVECKGLIGEGGVERRNHRLCQGSNNRTTEEAQITDPLPITVNVKTSIRDAIQIMDSHATQVVLVVDTHNRLTGLLTDGDVRRGLLRGVSLDATVAGVMNREYTWLPEGATESEALAVMRARLIHQIPVISKSGRVVDVFLLDHILQPKTLPNRIVIMAGGMGQRLRPLTASHPKPMLHVAGRPMLELIVERCREAGLRRVTIAVNYLKEQIMNYFGDGAWLGVDIDYVEEPDELGTVGAVGLLPEFPTEPLVVANGDVLTRVNFRSLLRFHQQNSVMATLCVREYTTEIPFGVVTTDGALMMSIEEKPLLHHYVSAGIAVLEPSAVGLIRNSERLDMPDLLRRVSERSHVAVFPIHEYWIDAGHVDALRRADRDWV